MQGKGLWLKGLWLKPQETKAFARHLSRQVRVRPMQRARHVARMDMSVGKTTAHISASTHPWAKTRWRLSY